MHELSIALNILDIAAAEAERHGTGAVRAVHLQLGPLSGVVKEALLSAYELACEGTPLADSRLVVEDVPIVVHCHSCDIDCEVASIVRMNCSRCGMPTADLVSGRELVVTALEMES